LLRHHSSFGFSSTSVVFFASGGLPGWALGGRLRFAPVMIAPTSVFSRAP
jgi:hypothetical protein